MKDKIEIRATAAPWHKGVELLVINGEGVGVNITFQKAEEGLRVDPTVVIHNAEAQTLMDDLWEAGFRPTEGAGSAGSLLATQKHLEDMRKLVFKGEKWMEKWI